jgi:hypothetical protein
VFSITWVPFLISFGEFSLHIYLLLYLGEFLKEGALVLGDTMSWRVKSFATTEGYHHMCLSSLDLQIDIFFQGFGG